MTPYLSAAVEGDVDAAIVRRLSADVGVSIGSVHVKHGKQNVRSRIASYNAASRQIPFLVLVDLDGDYDCAPALIADWLPEREARLCFRVAVRAVEAWLLGDRHRIANFLRVKQRDIPAAPEQIAYPKRTLVDIARASSSSDVRADIVPRPGSGRVVGPAYPSRLIEFVSSPAGWRPEAAAEVCESLRRAREALRLFTS
jgi:hypothetical protein